MPIIADRPRRTLATCSRAQRAGLLTTLRRLLEAAPRRDEEQGLGLELAKLRLCAYLAGEDPRDIGRHWLTKRRAGKAFAEVSS